MGHYVSFLVSQNHVDKCKIKESNPIKGVRFFFYNLIVLDLCNCIILIVIQKGHLKKCQVMVHFRFYQHRNFTTFSIKDAHKF